MLRKIIWRGLWGVAALSVWLVMWPGGAGAMDDPSPQKQIDRAKLTESFRSTGTQGGMMDTGAQGYVARESGSMTYPFVFTGSQQDGSYGGRENDNDCSKGQGVWILARDAAGGVYVTSSGPIYISPDVLAGLTDLTPGAGNLQLSNGEDHPFAQAKLGYDTKDATVWFNSDVGATEQPIPLSPAPAEIDNYRENGGYTLPRFDHFPEEIIISRWTSSEVGDGTGMTATRYGYGWSHPDFDDFIIVELVLENTSSRDYDEVYLGYLNYFCISKPGASYRKWNGYWFSEPGRRMEDDRYQYTEASNYTGAYRGQKVSYQYDGDATTSTANDRGEPRYGAEAISVVGWRAEGELYSPQYIGWGPVDVVPPFINDPETYVPITGTVAGGPDIPDSQPSNSHWWKRRSRTNIEFEPNEQNDTAQGIWDKLISAGDPIQNNPVEGGPTVEEREIQSQLHSQMYGPWALKRGEKCKIVVVFAAGVGGEIAGSGGEPMDFRMWAMSSGAQSQVEKGEEVLFNHIARGRQLYAMGYDLPNQPPDVESSGRTNTDRPLLLASNASGNVEMTWTDGADDASHPDYTGAEASDIVGYRIYSTTALVQTDPVKHAGGISGPWHLIADVKKGSASGGTYTFPDANSVTGFAYWYNLVPYGAGHSDWANVNAQNNAIAGAQAPVPTTLADLSPVVQKHIRAGTQASHITNAARHKTDGSSFAPVIAASADFDALAKKVLVVPNPWKDDGVHSFGSMGDNNKRMRFTNLPRLARISIFNSAGDLVMEVVHDGVTGKAQHTAEVSWSQNARSGVSLAAPGIYFYAVESLVPGHDGKVQTGGFMIIQ